MHDGIQGPFAHGARVGGGGSIGSALLVVLFPFVVLGTAARLSGIAAELAESVDRGPVDELRGSAGRRGPLRAIGEGIAVGVAQGAFVPSWGIGRAEVTFSVDVDFTTP